MLPSLAAKLAKAEKQNQKLSNKKYAAKFRQKMEVSSKGSFSDSFATIEEKEAWLEKREEAKRNSHSTFH